MLFIPVSFRLEPREVAWLVDITQLSVEEL